MIPYDAMAAGFLTGKYRSEADLSRSAQSVQKYLNPRGLAILGALDRVSQRLGTTSPAPP